VQLPIHAGFVQFYGNSVKRICLRREMTMETATKDADGGAPTTMLSSSWRRSKWD
jgi:hypothetical protein